MADVDLRRWIQPQHLERPALVLERGSGGRPPIVLRELFTPAVVEALVAWTETLEWAPEYRLFSDDDPVSPDRWDAADDVERAWVVDRPRTVTTGIDRGIATLVRFRHLVATAAFRSFLGLGSAIASRPAPSLTITRISARSRVRPHAVDPSRCELRLEVFLSRGWRSSDGGRFVSIDAHERVIRVAPAFNSAVIAVPSIATTFHVEPVRDGAQRTSIEVRYGR